MLDKLGIVQIPHIVGIIARPKLPTQVPVEVNNSITLPACAMDVLVGKGAAIAAETAVAIHVEHAAHNTCKTRCV